MSNQEDSLKSLIEASLPEFRNKWAVDAQEHGKKVLGFLTPLLPEEIIYAAGIFPYRLLGTQRGLTALAERWRPLNTCRFCDHVLESILSDEFPFVDGVIFTDFDDDERRLYDVCNYIGKMPFNYLIHVARHKTEEACDYFARSLRKLIGVIEEKFSVRITDDSLWEAISLYDKMRSLLMQLYEWRKREKPPVSGTEALGIVMASFFLPKEEYVSKLESLSGYLEKREAPVKHFRPRLLLASDHLDTLGYLRLVEDQGALVAMDDMDTGTRYFWKTVGSNRDPVYALAKRYLTRPADPRMPSWDEQVQQVIQWVKEYRIDGVLNFPHIGNVDRLCCVPFFTQKLKEAGIPCVTFQREYHVANVSQLSTRIGAFLEILEARTQSF
jgi:benzoyl-CoA reductase/2-hydroxyglutaryl-CoA dehydratase subunit BcrC/BadD/HgdB